MPSPHASAAAAAPNARLVRRFAAAWRRAIREEERAIERDASEAIIDRAAKASDRARRLLDLAEAGLPIPAPRAPQTKRNQAKATLALLGAIGRVIARAIAKKASIAKATAASIAARALRAAARLARRAARRAGRFVARIAIKFAPTTSKKETAMTTIPMSRVRAAAALYICANRAALQERLVALSIETGGLSAHDDAYNASHDIDDGEAFTELQFEIGNAVCSSPEEMAGADDDLFEAMEENLFGERAAHEGGSYTLLAGESERDACADYDYGYDGGAFVIRTRTDGPGAPVDLIVMSSDAELVALYPDEEEDGEEAVLATQRLACTADGDELAAVAEALCATEGLAIAGVAKAARAIACRLAELQATGRHLPNASAALRSGPNGWDIAPPLATR